jgi:hypothetical protein
MLGNHKGEGGSSTPGASPGEEPSPPSLPREESSAMPPTLDPPPLGTSPEPLEEVSSSGTAKVQQHVYFVRTVLHDARERCTMQQKLLYMLLIASRKLRHCFQGHPIKVITDQPL